MSRTASSSADHGKEIVMPDTQPRTKGEVVFENAQQELAVAIIALKAASLGFAIAGVDKSYRRRMTRLFMDALDLHREVARDRP